MWSRITLQEFFMQIRNFKSSTTSSQFSNPLLFISCTLLLSFNLISPSILLQCTNNLSSFSSDLHMSFIRLFTCFGPSMVQMWRKACTRSLTVSLSSSTQFFPPSIISVSFHALCTASSALLLQSYRSSFFICFHTPRCQCPIASVSEMRSTPSCVLNPSRSRGIVTLPCKYALALVRACESRVKRLNFFLSCTPHSWMDVACIESKRAPHPRRSHRQDLIDKWIVPLRFWTGM